MFAYNTSRHSPRLVLISLEIFVSEFQYYSAFFALSICSEVMFTFLLLLCLHSFLFYFFFVSFTLLIMRLFLRVKFVLVFSCSLTSGIERLLVRVKFLLVFSCSLISGIERLLVRVKFLLMFSHSEISALLRLSLLERFLLRFSLCLYSGICLRLRQEILLSCCFERCAFFFFCLLL